MSLEYENRTTVLGKFGEVCQGPNLDWRHKCMDEIILATPMVFADIFWEDLPYQAIVSESSSINFREPFGFEPGGDKDNCDPSTANVTTTLCDFVLPNLEAVSIGTDCLHYYEWRKRFCEKFPEYRGFNPFRQVGSRIEFIKADNSEAMLTFAGEVAGELSQATWDHLYRTYWVGEKTKVDQFDGFLKIFDEGISSQGTCTSYPLTPTCINMAVYILGQAAADAGGTVAPGDVVLPVGDPARPGDAPADNIVDIYAGTDFATSLDITGYDTIDLMVSWLELVVNEWGIDVISWMLGVGKNQTKCLAEVAACKQACRGGDCRQMLVSDTRDQARATRSSDFIRNKVIELFPYDVRIPMMQSPALKQLNKIIFMPWEFRNGEGEVANSLLWVWRDSRAANEGLFRDVPGFRDFIEPGSLPSTPLHSLDEFGTQSLAFEQRAWDRLYTDDKNCFCWWNNAETALIPQAPHLWLCIDGVSCDNVITLPCPNPGIQEDILSCTATTPNLVYDLTFANDDGMFNPCGVGTIVYVSSLSGDTSLTGRITTMNSLSTDAVIDAEITLDAVAPSPAVADCVWDGVNLDAGGKLVYKNC